MITILHQTVSPKPLFDWFDQHKGNRAKLRSFGYTDARITNWKTRGIPRGEVGNVAQLMGLTYEQYIEKAHVGKEWRQVAVAAFLSVVLGLSSTDAVSHNQNSTGHFFANSLKQIHILGLLMRFAKRMVRLAKLSGRDVHLKTQPA